MNAFELDFDLSSSEYVVNSEKILKDLAEKNHRIVKAKLHGKPVFIVTDVATAKIVFEDSKNFSFTPNAIENDEVLTDGAQSFMDEGLESSLLSSSFDEYKVTRKLFNQAFKHAYGDRFDEIDIRARQRINSLLETCHPPEINVLDLCRQYWMPLAADVIGMGSLSFADLALLARSSRTLVEGNGLHGDPEFVKGLIDANETINRLIKSVVDADQVQEHSALGFFLSELDVDEAISFTRTFSLAGIDTGSSALALQTQLLADSPVQRKHFLAQTNAEQQVAITEIASKEAPTLYTPRFAVHDVNLLGVEIPAGSFVQLSMYAMNRCANPDFDVDRAKKAGCPMHNNETLPFGHARHKCPGEALSRHLIPIFLDVFFRRFDDVEIKSCKRELNLFSRSIEELILSVK